MRSTFLATLALVASATFGAVGEITTPVTVKGNAFWVGDKRFYIRGVDYQPGGASNDLRDPLSYSSCLRDVPLFQELGLNTIRVYTVDNSRNHDECMQALSDAGIYVILDVNTPKFSINREYPKESYNDVYLQHVFATIDVFSKYTNTLGFFAANEVINDLDTTPGATYVKAAIRDMKQYIKRHVNRPIPIGYSAADVAENRMQQAHYFNCGDDPDARADFYGVNDYSWCGLSSFGQSSYREKTQNFTDYSIPIFLSEYGCNTQGPRPFTEVEAIYGPEMISVFSGGLVYEYTNETNNFGLVQLKDLDQEEPEKLPDFDTLKDMFDANPIPDDDGNYKEDNQPSECPPQTGLWEASNTLPDLPSKASTYMENGAGEPKGTRGPSNQWTPGSGPPPAEEPSDTEENSPGSSSPASAPGGRFENAIRGTWVAGVVVFTTAIGAMIL